MAVLAYPFEVRDSANTTTDNRKTGLSPTASNGKTIAASPATVLASAVTIVEVTGGHYAALYDAEANGDAAFPLDCGSTLANPNDRYITLDLTRDPGRVISNLDAAVSSRLPTSGYTAPNNLSSGGFAVAGGSSSTVQLTVPANTPVANWVGRNLYHGPTGAEANVTSASLSSTTATVGLASGWPSPSAGDTAFILGS